MSDIAIKVENLSKRYRIGAAEKEHDTFLSAVASWVKSPASNYKRLRKLSSFSKNGDAADVIWALKDVSFEVKQGEVIGVIGHNGAGKSTLLKILSRITPPTSGRIELNGRVASLLEVGTGFHPELTGRENIYLNGTILGMTKVEVDQKFDEIVDFSGVEKFIDTPVKRYSSGMKVRLAFSVAAHLEPEILLIDEVLAVGDIAFQQKCLGKMEDVAGQGRTVLFVSHNMTAVKQLCEKVYWVDAGSIRERGDTNSVIKKYEEVMLQKSEDGVALLGNWVNHEFGIQVTHIQADVKEKGNAEDCLSVEIQGQVSQPIARLGIGITISTLEGINVFKVGPNMARSWMGDVVSIWGIKFSFDRITQQLAGGEYVIHFTVHHPHRGVLIRAENACPITLIPRDIYKTEKYFQLGRNGIVPLSFSVNQNWGNFVS